MKILRLLPILAFVLFTFNACSSDDDGPNLVQVEAKRISNIHAPQIGGPGPGGGTPISGEFTKFDFATGEITTSETEWDIAFRGLTIIVNGGQSRGTIDEPERTGNAAAYIAESDFGSVAEVNTSLLRQDSEASLAIPNTGGPSNWYNYDSENFIVNKNPGRILVFRTRDGKYAKVEIISYYLDNPDPIIGGMNPNPSTPRYYTFQYEYQPNEGVTTF